MGISEYVELPVKFVWRACTHASEGTELGEKLGLSLG